MKEAMRGAGGGFEGGAKGKMAERVPAEASLSFFFFCNRLKSERMHYNPKTAKQTAMNLKPYL